MPELNCESVCLAAMALLDDEQAPLSAEEIEQHLAGCPGCRAEVGALKTLSALLDTQERRQHVANVWPMVSVELAGGAARNAPAAGTRAFVVLGLLLLGYKLVELIPKAELSLVFKLMPLVLVIAVFSYLQENPFKVNAGLRLEGE